MSIAQFTRLERGRLRNRHAGGLVDFAIIPHVEYDDQQDVANAEKWAGRLPVPTYAIDDETAVKVIDGTVEVVSEGHWKLFNP